MKAIQLVTLPFLLVAASGPALAADHGAAEEIRSEVHTLRADLHKVRLAADTAQGRYQPFPDSTGGSSRAKAQLSPTEQPSAMAGAGDVGAGASQPWSDQRSAD